MDPRLVQKLLHQTFTLLVINTSIADILVTDALNRHHQCATIQLDFQLPKNFKLKYTDKEGKESQPVIIHRAIYGSIERMMAILIEHTGGKWYGLFYIHIYFPPRLHFILALLLLYYFPNLLLVVYLSLI